MITIWIPSTNEKKKKKKWWAKKKELQLIPRNCNFSCFPPPLLVPSRLFRMSAKSKRWPPETCKSDRKQKRGGEALVKCLGGNALEPESATRKTALSKRISSSCGEALWNIGIPWPQRMGNFYGIKERCFFFSSNRLWINLKRADKKIVSNTFCFFFWKIITRLRRTAAAVCRCCLFYNSRTSVGINNYHGRFAEYVI